MYCKKCGNKNDENTLFCVKCGNRLNEDTNEIYYYNKKSSVDGLSLSGMILGIIAAIISIILFILSRGDDFISDRFIIPFFVLGLTTGILLIVGLVLSIIGTTKKPNPMGIIGIITSLLSFLFDLIIIIDFFYTVMR